MRQSGFMRRIEHGRKVRDDMMEHVMRQFMVDMFVLALNDPDVMGKSVLGYNRLKKVLDAVEANYTAFGNAVGVKSVDADYCREKLDERLRKIVPPDKFVPFLERYEWLAEIKYGRR